MVDNVSTITDGLPKGYRGKVVYDTHGESPREWSNLWTFCFAHHRYNVPWESDEFDKSVFMNQDDIETLRKTHLVIPVYGYDHGIFQVSANRTTIQAVDPHGWDSGLLGYAILSHEDMVNESGETEDEKMRMWVAGVLDGEIDVYNQYLSGSVFGVILEKVCECCGSYTEVDSLWGVYGDEDHFKHVLSKMVSEHQSEEV